VRITLSDGASVTSDSADVDQRLSACFKRAVRLARTAPDDFTIDQYHPVVDGLDPAGHRNTSVEQKLGSALFSAVGLASPVPEGSFLDPFQIDPLPCWTTLLDNGSTRSHNRSKMELHDRLLSLP
jgi:hypothetical protein